MDSSWQSQPALLSCHPLQKHNMSAIQALIPGSHWLWPYWTTSNRQHMGFSVLVTAPVLPKTPGTIWTSKPKEVWDTERFEKVCDIQPRYRPKCPRTGSGCTAHVYGSFTDSTYRVGGVYWTAAELQWRWCNGYSPNHGDQRRNYSGDDAADIHPIMVTSSGITVAMMQRIFT